MNKKQLNAVHEENKQMGHLAVNMLDEGINALLLSFNEDEGVDSEDIARVRVDAKTLVLGLHELVDRGVS